MGPVSGRKKAMQGAAAASAGHFSGAAMFLYNLHAGSTDKEKIEAALEIGQAFASSGREFTYPQMLEHISAIEGIVETVGQADARQRIVLADRLITGAGDYVASHPGGKGRIVEIVLPALKKTCRFKDAEEIDQFAGYCISALGAAGPAKTHIVFKLAMEVEGIGGSLRIRELMMKALIASRSPEKEVRRASREFAGRFAYSGNGIPKLIASGKGGMEAARDFLADSGSGGQVGEVFNFAYGCAIRGSRWGMEVAREIILSRGEAPTSRERFLEANANAIAGAKEENEKNPRAPQARFDYLMKLMKERGWWKDSAIKKVEDKQVDFEDEQGCMLVGTLALGEVGRKLAERTKPLSLQEMEEVFGGVINALEGTRGIVAGLRIGVIDSILFTVKNYVNAHPDSLGEAGDIALPAMVRLCEFEEPSVDWKMLGHYCLGQVQMGDRTTNYLLMRLFAGIGQMGIDIFTAAQEFPLAADMMMMSWDSSERRAGREMVRKLGGRFEMVGKIYAAKGDCSAEVAEFLGGEVPGQVIVGMFNQAYTTALRGSEWGMKVATQMIAQMDESPYSARDFSLLRGRALAGWHGQWRPRGAEEAGVLSRVCGWNEDENVPMEELKGIGQMVSSRRRLREERVDNALRVARKLSEVMRERGWSCAGTREGAEDRRYKLAAARMRLRQTREYLLKNHTPQGQVVQIFVPKSK